MKKNQSQFDFILDTVSSPKHDINAYVALLKRDRTLVQVGLPADPLPVSIFGLTGEASQRGRVHHWRHQGDPGDARLLRGARHSL